MIKKQHFKRIICLFVYFLSLLTSNNVYTVSVTVTGIVSNPDNLFTSPIPIVITPDGTKAYVGNFFASSFVVVDLTTNTATGLVSDPGNLFNQVNSIVITPDGTTAYAANSDGTTVTIIDVATDT